MPSDIGVAKFLFRYWSASLSLASRESPGIPATLPSAVSGQLSCKIWSSRPIHPYLGIVMRKRLNDKHVCIRNPCKQHIVGTARPKMKVLNPISVQERIVFLWGFLFAVWDFFLPMSRLKYGFRSPPSRMRFFDQRGIIIRIPRWNAQFLRLVYCPRYLARDAPLGVKVSVCVLSKSARLTELQAVGGHIPSDERIPIGSKTHLKHGISCGSGTGLRLRLRQRVRPEDRS